MESERNTSTGDRETGRGTPGTPERSDAERELAPPPQKEQRVALVTGGSGGIGVAIVCRLHEDGHAVACQYHQDRETAEALVGWINSHGGKAIAVKADVTSADSVEVMFKEVADKLGHVSILVNNAGVTRDTLLLRMDEEAWGTVIDTNLKSAYLCSRAATRFMMSQRFGRIINMSSVVGIMGNAGQANYAASKAGLIGFTRSLARELASRGVTVNAVAPGFIDAGMTEDLGDEVRERARAATPLGRFGTAEEVAHTVSFLASDLAGYITGQVQQVDGGMVMA